MQILAVDDDPAVLGSLAALLRAEHCVTAVGGGAEALAALERCEFDLVLTDLRMPMPDGLAVLRAARDLMPAPRVLVLTAVDTARSALEALRLGACDYLVKPVEPADLLAAVGRATPGSCADAAGFDYGMVGRSAAIRRVRRLIPLLARSREAVLVMGETGTGKDLLARTIHDQGPRAPQAFVAHNMAATPFELTESIFFGHVRGAFSGATGDHAGLFEQADDGTLFLDEVDSFPMLLQAKLLRVLESASFQRVGSGAERRVDVRVIASSATDLRDLVARGSFRADLFYRLSQLEAVLPPLRERPEDIPQLIRQFLDEMAAETRSRADISLPAMEALVRYPWPGNCRELRHSLRGAALMASGGVILPAHLPRVLRRPGSVPSPITATGTLHEVECEHIRRALKETGGNCSRAAQLLGIDRGTLARKIKATGLGEGDQA